MLHGEHRSRAIAVQSFRIIAELCDRVRLELLSLADAETRLTESQARQAIERVLERSAIVLEQLAHAMTVGEDPVAANASMTGFDDLVGALAQFQHGNADTRERHLVRVAARAQGLGGQLRALVRNAHWASSRGEIQAQLAEARLPAALRPAATWATLRANLDVSSVAFRHALRCGVCLALAIAFQRWQPLQHGFWIPMTTAIVLKPDFGGTFSFGALRVAGTFVGLLLATLLAHLAMDGASIRLVLLTLFCLGFRLLTQVNYGIGVAFLTGMLVLLLSFEGVSPGAAVGARLQATVAGSALALIAYALWPTRERRQIRTSLAHLLSAYRDYLRRLLLGQMDNLGDTRAATRVARTNAQASIERLRGEPRSRRNLQELKLAESLLANGNRLIRATLLLEAVLSDGHPAAHAGGVARLRAAGRPDAVRADRLPAQRRHCGCGHLAQCRASAFRCAGRIARQFANHRRARRAHRPRHRQHRHTHPFAAPCPALPDRPGPRCQPCMTARMMPAGKLLA